MAGHKNVDRAKAPTVASAVVPKPSLSIDNVKKNARSVVSVGYKKDEPVRFNLALSPSIADVVKRVAETKDITVTDVFRRAIAIMEAVDEEVAKGRTVYSIGDGNDATEFEIL